MFVVTLALVGAASAAAVLSEVLRLRESAGEMVSVMAYRDNRRTPSCVALGWVAGALWTAAVVSIMLQEIPWPWIGGFCALLLAPGLLLDGAHNRRVTTAIAEANRSLGA